MTAPTFSINYDYRCPFARNANEHVVAALEGGAGYDVQFKAFSLSQVHVADGEPTAWDNPEKRPELLALAAGIVVRDKFPRAFLPRRTSRCSRSATMTATISATRGRCEMPSARRRRRRRGVRRARRRLAV